jgi:hypothetical protein
LSDGRESGGVGGGGGGGVVVGVEEGKNGQEREELRKTRDEKDGRDLVKSSMFQSSRI